MRKALLLLPIALVLVASPPGVLNEISADAMGLQTVASPAVTEPTTKIQLPVLAKDAAYLSIVLGTRTVGHGIGIDDSGDVDTEVVSIGNPPLEARRTGNGHALPHSDGNQVLDYYMQFRVDDEAIFAGSPTTRARIEVEFFDAGTDAFELQYDAVDGGPHGDGRFKPLGRVLKTDTWRFRVVTLAVCDALFANRDNGADFRIADRGDGAEIIRRVTIRREPPGPSAIYVDSCGANPWDSNPDSEAIQACIDRACDGDTVLFTSGGDRPSYQGYWIDKTVVLVATTAKSDLTFSSTDPSDHAQLRATASLKGLVVRLFARSRVHNAGEIDDITMSHLSLDGGRGARRCFGPDGEEDGVEDNWGSWLPECTEAGDSWCRAGVLALDGEMDWRDANQGYSTNPSRWSTGLVVDDLVISNVECGTGLGFGGAAFTIKNTTIETAGDHVHLDSCAQTDADEGRGGWSDGITFAGPAHTVTGNRVLNTSDVGIVYFGGKETTISDNVVRVTAGNHGAFAGIAIHPWIFGDVSGTQVVGNRVTSKGSTFCGGIHAGINIGTHMWGAACVGRAHSSAVGNPGTCSAEPAQPKGTLCTEGEPCQEWAHVAAGATFSLRDNYVAGAQVNYLIEGLDLVGTLTESGNSSGPPRMSDWQEAKAGCTRGGQVDTWGTIDRVAHHPARTGWVDQRIHCER